MALGEIEGASKSLKKSLSEIEDFLQGNKIAPATALRAELHEKLEKFAIYWYRRGFRRGHRESNKQLVRGKVPETLKCDAAREFFTTSKRTVPLKSALK